MEPSEAVLNLSCVLLYLIGEAGSGQQHICQKQNVIQNLVTKGCVQWQRVSGLPHKMKRMVVNLRPVLHIFETTWHAFQLPHSHNLFINSQHLSSHSSWMNRVKYKHIHTGLAQGPTFEPSQTRTGLASFESLQNYITLLPHLGDTNIAKGFWERPFDTSLRLLKVLEVCT